MKDAHLPVSSLNFTIKFKEDTRIPLYLLFPGFPLYFGCNFTAMI